MRNYQKEAEWKKKKYKNMKADIDKDLAEKFLNVLDEPYAAWLKKQMNNYINEKINKK